MTEFSKDESDVIVMRQLVYINIGEVTQQVGPAFLRNKTSYQVLSVIELLTVAMGLKLFMPLLYFVSSFSSPILTTLIIFFFISSDSYINSTHCSNCHIIGTDMNIWKFRSVTNFSFKLLGNKQL